MERMGKRPCEAPEHHPNCPCLKCNLIKPKSCQNCRLVNFDHITPKSLARKVLKWTEEQLNDESNLMCLSYVCHRMKDLDTPVRVDVAKRQKKGEDFDWPKHRSLFRR